MGGMISAMNDENKEVYLDFLSSLSKNNDTNGAREEEAQLAVDVAQTENEVIIVAPIAGAPPENIELHLHNDVLTIRGERRSPMPSKAQYFYQETYWGKFSRTVVLPVEVKVEMAKAEYKNGTLMIILPKTQVEGKIQITIVDE